MNGPPIVSFGFNTIVTNRGRRAEILRRALLTNRPSQNSLRCHRRVLCVSADPGLTAGVEPRDGGEVGTLRIGQLNELGSHSQSIPSGRACRISACRWTATKIRCPAVAAGGVSSRSSPAPRVNRGPGSDSDRLLRERLQRVFRQWRGSSQVEPLSVTNAELAQNR